MLLHRLGKSQAIHEIHYLAREEGPQINCCFEILVECTFGELVNPLNLDKICPLEIA